MNFSHLQELLRGHTYEVTCATTKDRINELFKRGTAILVNEAFNELLRHMEAQGHEDLEVVLAAIEAYMASEDARLVRTDHLKEESKTIQ